MATIRFTAAERPGLLAEAVLETCAELAAGGEGDGRELGALADLAAALKGSNGKRFDELLSEHFKPLVLDRLGIDPNAAGYGVDPATGGETEVAT